MITAEQVLGIWDYETVMGKHSEIKGLEMFKAFREYTGNYRLNEGKNKGLGLLGALEYCKHRNKWRNGTNLYRPFGYFESYETDAEGVYASLVEVSVERYREQDSLIEMFLRGFCVEAPKRGLDFSSISSRKKAELFFTWLAGCCKGIEIEKVVLDRLNATSASTEHGWLFERASGRMEAYDVDIVGRNPKGKEKYFSVKSKGGAFSLSCVEAYRKKPGCDLPDYYINEDLEIRKKESLDVVTRIDITQ